MTGNSFTNWNKVTPRHNAFVQKILQSNCHVISTIRTKQDYVLTDKNGKMVPEKVGLKGITRDGLDYEFTILFDVNIKHMASASKDRTGLFQDQPEEVITPDHGRKILDWCNSGISLSEIKIQVNSADTVDKLRELLKNYPEFRSELEPLAFLRKEELNRNFNPTKFSSNGIS